MARKKRGRKKRKTSGTLNFRSKETYRKWLAYNYIHNKRQMGRPPHKRIKIRGKPHRVKHKKSR